jgi:hypothetical protein
MKEATGLIFENLYRPLDEVRSLKLETGEVLKVTGSGGELKQRYDNSWLGHNRESTATIKEAINEIEDQ